MPPRKVTGREDVDLSEDDLCAATQPVEKKLAKSVAVKKPAAVKRKAAAPVKSRAALSDRTNVQTQEEDDEEPKVKRAKTAQPKPHKENVRTIPETQQERSVVEQTEIDVPSFAPTFQTSTKQPTRYPSESTRPQPPRRDRSASASGTDRERKGGDVETRRQLTSMTRECERLNLKNQTLEDLVKDKAETNFDRLKREADLKTKHADELIASLRKELAQLKKSCSAGSAQADSLVAQISILNDALHVSKQDVTKLAEELSVARQSMQAVENERKALEAKVVAARQQMMSDTVDPKSASRGVGLKMTESQKEAKMKESLYTDLTGLIIRGVKRKDGEDEYDCIQTGRNGTLHFHLSVANDASTNPRTPGLSYEDAEFSYEPLLDPSNDKMLLESLPDYLCEEICFPRNHAVKFFTKVVESMTKKIIIEDE